VAGFAAKLESRAMPDDPVPNALERHYTVAQVSELWGWSDDTVRKVFRDEPGVLQNKIPTIRARKRQNVTLRIPESVLIRVHARLAVK
jgi:hypothetical protein